MLDFYEMTKKELVAEIAKHGISVTTRPRKSTLVALLEELEATDKAKADRETRILLGSIAAFIVAVAILFLVTA